MEKTEHITSVVKRIIRDEYVEALAEDCKQRSTTFKVKKGKGSYARRSKHSPDYR